MLSKLNKLSKGKNPLPHFGLEPILPINEPAA